MYRAIWIDQPQEPNYDKLIQEQITAAIFDLRFLAQKSGTPRGALPYLESVRNKLRGNPGAFAAAQGEDSLGAWPSYDDLTGEEWADWVYELFQLKVAPGSKGDFPVVHLNPETDDVDWQMSMLRRWRARSPRRTTVWTPVAHKANIFQAVGTQIAALNIIVGPQCYVGNMDRVESSNEIQAWQRIGVPREQIMPFLPADDLGEWWGEEVGAIAFIQSLLP